MHVFVCMLDPGLGPDLGLVVDPGPAVDAGPAGTRAWRWTWAQWWTPYMKRPILMQPLLALFRGSVVAPSGESVFKNQMI